MKKKLGIVVTALALIVVMVATLCACSSYGSIKSAFKKEGYEEAEVSETYKEQVKKVVGEDYADKVTIHILTKNLSTAIIVEFKSKDDIVDAIGKENAENAYEELQKLDTVNGNCTIISISPEALKIFKGTK